MDCYFQILWRSITLYTKPGWLGEEHPPPSRRGRRSYLVDAWRGDPHILSRAYRESHTDYYVFCSHTGHFQWGTSWCECSSPFWCPGLKSNLISIWIVMISPCHISSFDICMTSICCKLAMDRMLSPSASTVKRHGLLPCYPHKNFSV